MNSVETNIASASSPVKCNIIHLVSNKVWGGGEQYVYDLCKYFSEQGCNVAVYARPIKALLDRFSQLDIALHTLPLKGSFDVKSARALAKQLRGNGPTVVHVHNFKDAFTAVYAKMLSGNKEAKVVVTRHLVKKGKGSLMYRWLFGRIGHVIFVSALARERFMQGKVALAPEKCSVVLNSIVLPAVMEPRDIRKEVQLPAGCVLAMYHGRIAKEKGLDTLIDAMATVSGNVAVVLIGTGDKVYEAELAAKVERLGLAGRVVFAGFRHPVLPYLGGCDFGVLPSIVEESSSLTCMEYLSQGRAVIATDNGGQREYLTNGMNAMLVPPGDASRLADAITRLSADAAMRVAMGMKAKEYFTSSLNYDVFVNKVATVYNNLFE